MIAVDSTGSLEYAVQMAVPRQTELENQIRLWIKQNKKENSRLEFKWQIDLGTPDDKAEFIRDVMALANSEGEYPRKEGYLVVGARNGKCHDIQNEHYDGARFGQVLDAYIYPSVNVLYEEFGNKSRGRIGVLIVKPDSDFLYVVSKALQVGKGQPLLSPGQSWGRKSDRKILLTGKEIHARLRDILTRRIEDATAPLQARIDKLQLDSGPAFEAKRIRFEMEANTDWAALEAGLQKLLPYAREFDHAVKHEVLDAIREVTARTRRGMPVAVAQSVDTLLIEVMPLKGGGLQYPARVEITPEDQELLKRMEHLTFEMTWDASRYLRDIQVLEIGAHLYWVLIRYATLNGLEKLKTESLHNARYCRDICMEERRGKAFPEGQKKLGEEIDDALDAFQDDYVVRKLSAEDLTASILSACVAIIKKGEAVDWQSAKGELPLATSVAVACKGSEIVGVGSVKRERRKYAASVSAKSGVKFPPETLELGYVAVDPAHQGRQLSSRIATLLASRYKGRLFATTYNDRMKRTLARIGFVRNGNEWKGKREMLSLWEKE
jgi:hypothetical protein